MFVECTHPKSCHSGQRQDSGLQRLRSKVFMSAELHRSRESASLRTGVNKIMTLLVNVQQSISHAMGGRFARGIGSVSLAFKRRM